MIENLLGASVTYVVQVFNGYWKDEEYKATELEILIKEEIK